MKKTIYMAVLAVLAAALHGCGDKPEQKASDPDAQTAKGKPSKKKSQFPVDDLSPDTVIATVNGVEILQSDYAKWRHLRDRIYRVANKIPFSEKSDKTSYFARDSRMHVPVEIIRRELMRQEAERLGITVTDADLRTGEKNFMKSLNRAGEKFSSVKKLFGEEDFQGIKDVVYADVREGLTITKSATNNVTSVTDAEIDARIKAAKEWNDRANATNAVQIARAAKAKADILNGGIFADITSNRADRAIADGTQWQILDIQEALEENETLGTWLAGADIGDISDPIELDDSISIIGVVNAWMDDGGEDSEAPKKQYQLVRCAFDAYETIDEPDDRTELAAIMVQERRVEAARILGERLVKTAKIEFPLGEKIFMPKRAKKPSAKHPAKGRKGKDGKTKKEQGK